MSLHYIETSSYKDNKLIWDIFDGQLCSTLHHIFPLIDKDYSKKIDHKNYDQSLIKYYNKLSEDFVVIYYPIKVCTGEASEFDEDNYPVSFEIYTEYLDIPESDIKIILENEFPNSDINSIFNIAVNNSVEYFDNSYYGNSVTYGIIVVKKDK